MCNGGSASHQEFRHESISGSYYIIPFGNLLYEMLNKKSIAIYDRVVMSVGYPTDSNLLCKLQYRYFDIAPTILTNLLPPL